MEDVSAMNWKCYDCNMTFSNPTQLKKHKTRFCVGGGLGDPDQLMLRKGFKSDVKKDYDDLPAEDEPTKYNHNTDPKVKQLAETHGRTIEAIHIRNRDLERQKEEIRRRLEDLGRRPVKDDGNMNVLLQELKEQEARNRFLLEDLRRQLVDAKNVPSGAQPKVTKQIAYPVYYGNSLVAEISAVRQSYLSNGGADPDILQQLAQMQAEAQAIDDSLKNQPGQNKKDNKHSDHLLTLELENERLQRQLLLLQEQNSQAINRRKNEREGRNGARVTQLQSIPDEVPPLDVGYKNQLHYDIKTMHSEWAPIPDPLKSKIDKDLENKFGHNIVARRVRTGQYPYDEKLKSQGEFKSFLPDKHKEKEKSEKVPKFKSKVPYYKVHLTSQKLNEVDSGFREEYADTSIPNIKPADLAFRLENRDKQNNETPPPRHDRRTKFEDDFFLDTSRTENKQARKRPTPRPQLIIGE